MLGHLQDASVPKYTQYITIMKTVITQLVPVLVNESFQSFPESKTTTIPAIERCGSKFSTIHSGTKHVIL